MIVRIVLWNLADMKTTLDELRPRLVGEPRRTWISDEATERFGAIEVWESAGAAAPLPAEILELIGTEPELVEEFTVEPTS